MYMEASLVFVSHQHIMFFTISSRGCLSFCSVSPHVAAFVCAPHQVFFSYVDWYAEHGEEKHLLLGLKPREAVLFSDCTTAQMLIGAMLYVLLKQKYIQ